MKLSTRSRYGIRALVDIASHADGKPVLIKDIGRRQDIPLHYLHQIVAPLIKAGVLSSVRGARGGVSLSRDPREMDLGYIVRTLEGSISPVKCVDDPGSCSRSSYCTTRGIWDQVNQAVLNVLESTTLDDLVQRYRQHEQVHEGMFYI